MNLSSIPYSKNVQLEVHNFKDQYNNIRFDNLDSYISDGNMKDILDEIVDDSKDNNLNEFVYNPSKQNNNLIKIVDYNYEYENNEDLLDE